MPSFGKSIALVLILLGWAAVAQAVPVDLLKTPVPADVACGGAVDEAATLKAVQVFEEKINAYLRTKDWGYVGQ